MISRDSIRAIPAIKLELIVVTMAGAGSITFFIDCENFGYSSDDHADLHSIKANNDDPCVMVAFLFGNPEAFPQINDRQD